MRMDGAANNTGASENIAIRGLNFLAAEPERLGRFLSLTGLGPHNLREAARQPAFLAQIMAYICADEALLVTFAQAHQLNPKDVARAHVALNGPGADFPG